MKDELKDEAEIKEILFEDSTILGYSAVYTTLETRQLNRIYCLSDGTLDDVTIARIQAPLKDLDDASVRKTMHVFSGLAVLLSGFVGVRLEELLIDNRGELSLPEVSKTVQAGYLDLYPYKSRLIIAPTLLWHLVAVEYLKGEDI